MFKTGPEFVYDTIIDSNITKDYILNPGDVFSMAVLSNNGYALVDILGQSNSINSITYIVKTSGYVALPLLDSLYVKGLSLIALEKILSDKYSYYFQKPFVIITLKSARVLVFQGQGKGANVPLDYNNMQLIELIANVGGLSKGKAYRIKVIRGSPGNYKVYLFDFSTYESFSKTNFIIANNDIIYIEPTLSAADINSRILPILGLITTTLLIFTTISSINKK
jgi:polysaccharide export outer membrane protein